MPVGIGPDAFSNLSGWSRLRSLVLRFHHGGRALTGVVKLLEEFHGPELREVVLELEPATSIPTILRDLSFDSHDQPGYDARKELEDRLLRVPHLSMTWVSPPLRRHSFWACELSKRFPVLSQRGALTLKSQPGDFSNVTSIMLSIPELITNLCRFQPFLLATTGQYAPWLSPPIARGSLAGRRTVLSSSGTPAGRLPDNGFPTATSPSARSRFPPTADISFLALMTGG